MNEAIKHYLKKHGFERFAPKAVLFDMDGVLYDSMPNHVVAWTNSMAQFGIKMDTNDAYATEGARGVDTIRMMVKRQQGRDIDEALLNLLTMENHKFDEKAGIDQLRRFLELSPHKPKQRLHIIGIKAMRRIVSSERRIQRFEILRNSINRLVNPLIVRNTWHFILL